MRLIALGLVALWPWLLGTLPANAAGEDDDERSLEELVVTATRSPGLIRDQPLRVEAVPAEEIEENLTVQPGNLTSLLNELPSVRVQSTGAGLGGAGLQLRGMPTRHTLILTDGLPLLGAEPDGFGLLQTPPLDLSRVEVVKGAASALYGGSALGGVLNLVSQTAAAAPCVLANATSRGGRDAEAFLTADAPAGWSGTLTAGAHDQSREDLSGEGWSEIPGYRRYTLRPRAWWRPEQDRSVFLTAGLTDEYRAGGTLGERRTAGPFAESMHTQRLDGGLVAHSPGPGDMALDGRFSVTSAREDRTFGTARVASTQTTVFAEESTSGSAGGHSWVAGLAFEHDSLSAHSVPGVGYAYEVPAAFVQDEYSPSPWLKIAVSGRVDGNDVYGTFFSPRLSALVRPDEGRWSLRASAGGGYAAPTPFVDEVEATNLSVLLPLRGLRTERGATESIDAKWAAGAWDVNASVFDSSIRGALAVRPYLDRLQIVNAPGPRRAPGAEVLIHYAAGGLQMIGSWSVINATEASLSGLRQAAPLVPRHSAEFGGIWTDKQRGRIGLEMNYTGRQALEDDPYRSVSEPYYDLNALAEIRWGRLSLFMNAINLTNVRQTRVDPLLRPTQGLGGNPITDLWGPVDGRVFNIGVRVQLGKNES